MMALSMVAVAVAEVDLVTDADKWRIAETRHRRTDLSWYLASRSAASHLRCLFLLGLVLEDQLTLEEERAGGDHGIARAEAGLDDQAVAGLAADLDGAEGECPWWAVLAAGRKTNLRFPSRRRRRRGRSGPARWPSFQEDSHEHAELEHAVRVLGLGQDGDGPGLWGRPRRRSRAAGPRTRGRGRRWREVDRPALDLGQLGEIRLGDVGRDPDGATGRPG